MPGNLLTVDTNFPKQTGNTQQDVKTILNYLYMLLESLRYTLTNLDTTNWNETALDGFIDEIRAGVVTAETVISNTTITNALAANKATISELTVDRLDTSDKVQKYLSTDVTDDNFQRLFDQYHEFITAATDGLDANKVQATNRSGQLLYWVDDTHAAASATVTDYPVYTYAYTETNKMRLGFKQDPSRETELYIPVIELGAGTGTEDYGKGFIYKGVTGLYIEYLHSTTGEVFTIKLTDSGIDFSGVPNVIYNTSTILTGLVQLWVQSTTPTNAKTNDVWIDTDDYTRYDTTALTGNTTLAASDNEVITCSGTFTVTLHAGTSAGIIKKLYNIGAGIITIAGTINGATNMCLYPTESVELITDGTNWRC